LENHKKSKSKNNFLVFRPHGKPGHLQDCELVNNGKEMGMPENPDLKHPVERILHNKGETKNLLLGVVFDEYLSFNDHKTSLCAQISKSVL
jgi:hypothetical protein